ncbi:MAG: hypothetical protein WA056_03930 [Gallionella sp.]|jgi:hypothetical protein|nr:hypothetical protein [Gallionella sp.]MCK9353707.1 hypothetical protein [Gallionella sp.]
MTTWGQHEREALTLLLSVGETYFFRDREQHVLLRDIILPELLERRKAERTLCSAFAGNRPYPAEVAKPEYGSRYTINLQQDKRATFLDDGKALIAESHQ